MMDNDLQREIWKYGDALMRAFPNCDTMGKADAIAEFARCIGFEQARVAVWNCNGDGTGCESLTPVGEMLEYDCSTPPAKGEHDIGIYLHKVVYSGLVNGTNLDDEPIGETFDTASERDAWMKRELNPATGGERTA